ncbi:hypothetical protein BDY21DRAFT_145121 [Lineolata rhizophorae]|uniref:Uncharacterized protein n=1 Tax=Lineolata rhizophorae TaxID=578093 RepID=A0A6A6NMY0_9PEZI|nr:hypothetical protein BDY21DRAFT_145121 [Lineolata rhizophorae]
MDSYSSIQEYHYSDAHSSQRKRLLEQQAETLQTDGDGGPPTVSNSSRDASVVPSSRPKIEYTYSEARIEQIPLFREMLVGGIRSRSQYEFERKPEGRQQIASTSTNHTYLILCRNETFTILYKILVFPRRWRFRIYLWIVDLNQHPFPRYRPIVVHGLEYLAIIQLAFKSS